MADEVALADALQLVSYIRDRNTGENHEIADLVARALASGAQGTADIAVGKADAAQSTADAGVAKADAAQAKADANGVALETKYELGLGTEIPAGADLNDYVEPGIYYTVGDITQNRNMPENTANAGILVIHDFPGGVRLQTYTIFNGEAWSRRYRVSDGNWREWTRNSGIDAIVAEGTNSAGWTWRKYANGVAEAWNVSSGYSVTNIATWNNIVFGIITVQYPFAFLGNTSAVVSVRNGSSLAWSDVVNADSSKVEARILTSSIPSDTSSIIVRIHVQGRWK